MFFTPQSNLGPLLGIFVTGPVGALAGALWGIVRSAKNVNEHGARAIFSWFSAVWVLTLLYTLFTFGYSKTAVLHAIGLQGLILGSSVFLLYIGDTRTRLSHSVHRCRPIAVIIPILIMVTTVFPPVMRPRWAPDSTAPLPKVAFIFDGRFDASRHVPLFAVDQRTLVLVWVISGIAALGLSLGIIMAHGRAGPDIGPPGAASPGGQVKGG